MLELIALIVLIILGALYSFTLTEAKTEAEAKAKAAEGVINDVKTAKNISDASSNDDYAKRLRDEFIRK
jgi:hypothetical protein